MPYRILRIFIQNKEKTKEQIAVMADVYYAAGRITAEEYVDVIGRIGKMEQVEE